MEHAPEDTAQDTAVTAKFSLSSSLAPTAPSHHASFGHSGPGGDDHPSPSSDAENRCRVFFPDGNKAEAGFLCGFALFHILSLQLLSLFLWERLKMPISYWFWMQSLFCSTSLIPGGCVKTCKICGARKSILAGFLRMF